MSEPDNILHPEDPVPVWKDMVIPYIQGELSPEDHALFEGFLEQEQLCKLAVYEAQQTLKQLHQIPTETVPDTLASSIMETIQEERRRERIPFPRAAMYALAASVAVLIGAFWIASSRIPDSEPFPQSASADQAVQRGLNWLAQAQEQTGEWDGMRWGGNNRYTLGLTGLSLLALTRNEDEAFQRQHRLKIRNSVTYILSTQSPDGVFGGARPGTPFDHPIATSALLDVYASSPTKELKAALDRALQAIVIDLHPFQDPGNAPNDKTIWSMMALQQAATLGWDMPPALDPEIHPPPYGDKAALIQHSNPQLNLYKIYLTSASLAAHEPDTLKTIQDEIRDVILSAQETNPRHAGSWPLSGHISATGGRVYSTAMATLTLSLFQQNRG